MKTLKTIISERVTNHEITDRACEKTGQAIMLNDGYYYISGEFYSDKINVDTLIQEITQDSQATWADFYTEEGDNYWSTYEDEGTIIDSILDEMAFIDKDNQRFVINSEATTEGDLFVKECAPHSQDEGFRLHLRTEDYDFYVVMETEEVKMYRSQTDDLVSDNNFASDYLFQILLGETDEKIIFISKELKYSMQELEKEK